VVGPDARGLVPKVGPGREVEMGGGGTEREVMRRYADIAADPMPSHRIGTVMGHSSRVSPMAPTGKAQTAYADTEGSKGYVLPPVESKFDRALARHYALKYPATSELDQDDYSKEWLVGSHVTSLSNSQPPFRPKTPKCPWGVDRKVFAPSASVVAQIRLSTAPRGLGSPDAGRSHTSADFYPLRKGMVSPQVFDLGGQHGPVVPQVIPGYTGHFTGFRETVGKTYGHAEMMLGRVSPALVPMYRKEDIRGDEMGICRSGYPSFVRPTDRWSRRPPTAMKPLVKDPLARVPCADIIEQLSNILIERVKGDLRVSRVVCTCVIVELEPKQARHSLRPHCPQSAPNLAINAPGKASWPIHKALLDLRRACMNCAAAPPLMTQAEVRRMFQCMKVELHETAIDKLFEAIADPSDKGMIRIEALCTALDAKQHAHPLTSLRSPNRPVTRFSQSMR